MELEAIIALSKWVGIIESGSLIMGCDIPISYRWGHLYNLKDPGESWPNWNENKGLSPHFYFKETW